MQEKIPEEAASVDYGIGLLSDLIPESVDPVSIWNTLCSSISEEEKNPGRVQKIILGFLSRHSSDEASHQELVAVSYKLTDALLREIRGVTTEEEVYEETLDDIYGQDVKNQYIQKGKEDRCGVIAIKDGATWFHVHETERLPKGNWTVAIHPRLDDLFLENAEIKTDSKRIGREVKRDYDEISEKS